MVSILHEAVFERKYGSLKKDRFLLFASAAPFSPVGGGAFLNFFSSSSILNFTSLRVGNLSSLITILVVLADASIN